MNRNSIGGIAPASEFAAHIASAPERPLPRAVAERAKNHLLDTIAAIVSGSALPAGRSAIRFVRSEGAPREAHVVGSDIVTSATSAAWANAMHGHADETDDHHLGSITHPGSCVVPASMALAELAGADGTGLLSAVALGYDVAARVGMALGNDAFFNGWSVPSFGGGFGAAAASCALLKLDERKVRHVLSYVAQQSAGTRAWQHDPDHIEKAFVLAGAPTRQAVNAALLVRSGFTAGEDAFSGSFNFFSMHSPSADPARLVHRLGVDHEIMNASMKKFSVGGPIQAPLEGLSGILARGIAPDDIVEVNAHIPVNHAPVVDNSPNPSICLQHVLALLLVDGGVDHGNVHDEARLRDPAVLAQRAKIRLVHDHSMERVAPRRPVHVEARLRSGTIERFEAEAVRGTCYLPWTYQEVRDKALRLMRPVLGHDRSAEVCDLVARIEDIAETRHLMTLLVGSR